MNLSEKPIVGETLEVLQKTNSQFVFPKTGFNFLNDHFGIRPGCIHLLLGETGKGKSTLCRSIAQNYSLQNQKIIYYSAEETLESFSLGLDAKDGSEENIFFISEKKLQEKYENFGVDVVLKIIKSQLVEHKAKLLFYDNPTAGRLVSDLKSQEKLYNGLRTIADSGIGLLVPVHTSSNKQKNFLTDPSDVRGSKHISNIADYFYAFYNFNYTFDGEEKIFSAINTIKSRFHSSGGSFYSLNYDREKRKYTHDYNIKFDKFLEFWKKRQKL